MNDNDTSRNEPSDSELTGPTDAALAELIAVGDWADDVDPPRVATLVGLVARRRRTRRAVAVGGAGLACTAAVVAVLAFQPRQADSTGPAPATQSPTSSQIVRDLVATCTRRNQLVSDHGPRTYHGRRADTVYLENTGSFACMVTDLPQVELGTRDYHYTIDSSRAVGPWVLRHDEALAITVVAAPTHSCLLRGSGVRGLSDQVSVELGGVAYTFPVHGMHGGDCTKPPTLAPVRVVTVRD